MTSKNVEKIADTLTNTITIIAIPFDIKNRKKNPTNTPARHTCSQAGLAMLHGKLTIRTSVKTNQSFETNEEALFTKYL